MGISQTWCQSGEFVWECENIHLLLIKILLNIKITEYIFHKIILIFMMNRMIEYV